MRVLVPVLDSVNYLPAVRYLVREFLNGERFEVHLLDVRKRKKDLQSARGLLERFHVPCSLHARSGDQARIIDAFARRLWVSRIVLGTARPWSLTRLAEEAVIDKVRASARVPVTVVAGKSASPLERYGVAAGLGAMLGLLLIG
jgi:nucleotide-binding universal stress UspA family protein